MERNDWNNRQGDSGERKRHWAKAPKADEDSYRGAYRLDTASDHRNHTTWEGFEKRGDRNRRQGTDYNQDFNRNYINDYNRNYNSDQRLNRGELSGGRDWSRNSRYGDRDEYSHNSNSQPKNGDYRSRFGEGAKKDRAIYGFGNLHADYGPDNYGTGGGANYGNMAGSLSYGYDGSGNSDPDWNRRYDPMSGHHRSYHGHYESRHPARDQNRDSFDDHSSNNGNSWF